MAIRKEKLSNDNDKQAARSTNSPRPSGIAEVMVQSSRPSSINNPTGSENLYMMSGDEMGYGRIVKLIQASVK